jgi:hypothetical protein
MLCGQSAAPKADVRVLTPRFLVTHCCPFTVRWHQVNHPQQFCSLLRPVQVASSMAQPGSSSAACNCTLCRPESLRQADGVCAMPSTRCCAAAHNTGLCRHEVRGRAWYGVCR